MQITVRINGGINKSKQEIQVEIQNRNSIRLGDILKEACKRFNHKEKSRSAKLYNRNGLEILDEDV